MNTAETISTPKPLQQRRVSALEADYGRISSIDILRAITMVLMIFVNDLGTLKDIPAWLEHVSGDVDGMGLADVVFPAFLFIVGMSIPYAIENRRKKGDNNSQIFRHIVVRTVALLVMGLFLVNGENLNGAATGMSRSLWNPLCCLSFILIWNLYPKSINPNLKRSLQGIGIVILLVLAFVYKGGEGENIKRFSTHWWGILGLIGWCYLTASLITTFAGKRTVVIAGAWIIFTILSMVSTARLLPKEGFLRVIPGAIIGGTLVALSLGGVLTIKIFKHYRKQSSSTQLMAILFGLGAALLLIGFYANTFWAISKIRATAPWLFLCSGFTILGFTLIYGITDVKQKESWFKVIKPAGTDTLLCYLIPYFAYAAMRTAGVKLPDFMITGGVGLLKSFLFALLCVWIAGMLVKKRSPFKAVNGIKFSRSAGGSKLFRNNATTDNFSSLTSRIYYFIFSKRY